MRYDTRVPSPCTVVLSELKATLKESQQVVIDNINSDFAVDLTSAAKESSAHSAQGRPATRNHPIKYYLIAEDKPRQKISITGRTAFVGRDESCEIVLDSLQVSRRHCVLQLEARGLIFLDLESANGVFHNGVRTKAGELQHGDKLSFGSYSLIIHQELLADRTVL